METRRRSTSRAAAQVVSRHAGLRHGLLRSGWALKICVLEQRVGKGHAQSARPLDRAGNPHRDRVGIFAGPHRSHSGALAGLLRGFCRVACAYINGL